MATKSSARGHRSTAHADLKAALNPDIPVMAYPPGLPEHHKDIWRETVNTRTADYWSKGDIPLLRMYCRTAVDVERLSREIEEEGETIENARGNMVVNPKLVVRGFAESRMMSLCTKLRMQPSARMSTDGEAGKMKRKRAADSAAKAIEGDEDDLLAGAGSMMQ